MHGFFAFPASQRPTAIAKASAWSFLRLRPPEDRSSAFAPAVFQRALQENVTGLLAPSEDVESLSHHILRYLQDDAFWQSSSAKGMEWTKEHFDLDQQDAQVRSYL